MAGAGLTSEAIAGLTPLARVKAILGGSAGNLVEWYDWFAYAAFSLYFAKVFFPKGDQTAQLLQTAAVFAVGFLARPVGAWLMGVYADRAGRKAALMLSVLMMCLGSLVVAVVPGYAVIGAAAPAILTAARLLQGLSVGGEYGASATYMSEMAGKARRGFWSSFQFVTLIGGQLTALGVLIVLQHILTRATWRPGAGASPSSSARCWRWWCSGSRTAWRRPARSRPPRRKAAADRPAGCCWATRARRRWSSCSARRAASPSIASPPTCRSS